MQHNYTAKSVAVKPMQKSLSKTNKMSKMEGLKSRLGCYFKITGKKIRHSGTICPRISPPK